MNRVPPINLLGRSQQPQQFHPEQYNQYAPQYNVYSHPHHQPELRQSQTSQQQQHHQLSNYHPEIYHQYPQINQQRHMISQNHSQYGPPLDWYDSSELRRSRLDHQIHPQSSYIRQDEVKKQIVHAPMIDFYPPDEIVYNPHEKGESLVDEQGRINSYQDKNSQQNLNNQFTKHIQQQVKYLPQGYQEVNDPRMRRQRWEVDEIYGNLQATFDDKGRIQFNNIKEYSKKEGVRFQLEPDQEYDHDYDHDQKTEMEKLLNSSKKH